MKCSKCQELLGLYGDGLLDASQDREVARHLGSCPNCEADRAAQEQIGRRLQTHAATLRASSRATAIMERITAERAAAADVAEARRLAMRKTYARVGVGMAAAAAIAAALWVPWGGEQRAQATAAEVLAQAAKAVSGLHAVYMKLRTRTLPADNFECIGAEYDFVPHEMWKEFGEIPRWRVEKPRRVAAMDGDETRLLIHSLPGEPARALASKVAAEAGGMVGFLLGLLDVDKVLDMELRLAQQNGWELELKQQNGPGLSEKLIVTVEAKAQGDFTNDWCKNKAIVYSDNRRVYRFDAQTKRLEDLAIWIHAEAGDVQVLDVASIAYDPPLEPGLFQLQIPEYAVFFETPELLPDNEKYACMSPADAARAFFTACHDENWEEALKFMAMSAIEPLTKEYLGGLEVIEIGAEFKSGLFPGWFVPYEVRLQSGRVLKHNLALRNDNPARRYVVDGGL